MKTIIIKLTSLNKLAFLAAVLVIILVAFCYWQNNDIVTTFLNITDSSIPQGFNGFKILQVSDLHNKLFGKNQDNIIKKIKTASPDIIVVTGDLIDKHRTDIKAAMLFINEAVKIAPVYYITGNHEALPGLYPQLKKLLLQSGVTVLDDTKTEIEYNGDIITLLGLKDYSFINLNNKALCDVQFRQKLNTLAENDNNYKILLSHHPEYFDIYSSQNVNLVFSGHTHGGQIRLPLIGGLAAPGQGILPKYTSGVYSKGNTSMVVSRGLGNSIFPQRIFNRPELVVVTLKCFS